ncbi:hypothetical protein GC209_15085 [bacterium]|nr:hypothetical protein [bacterium]
MPTIAEMGESLARDVIAAAEELGDDKFFDKVAKVVSDASPTLLEAYTTAYRVLVAEQRARRYLEAALRAKRGGTAPPPAPRASDTGH